MLVRRRASIFGILAGMLLVLGSAVQARALPRLLTQQASHPFRVRPPTISYTGDGTGFKQTGF